MKLSVQFLGDASKNCIAWVRGQVLPGETEAVEVLDLADISSDTRDRRPRTLKLVSAMWTLQEKMGFYLWMDESSRNPEDLLLVMESRNFLRLDSPIILDKWKGKLFIEPFKVDEPKWFWFQLDFDKAFAR